jgi:peptidoglycan/xylan/chitin deacetylase (PgdA/CDA1 family)
MNDAIDGFAVPAGWPPGRALAVSVNVMLEQWADEAAPGIGPMGNPLKAGVLDLQARSWADYGPKSGIWRLLDILAAHDVTAVVYVSGLLAERYPNVVAAIVRAGHVIAAHGWTQDVIPPYQAAPAEEADLRRSIAALALAGGVRPRGYMSPRCTPSTATPALLLAAGLDWHADYFDADLPRHIALGDNVLTAIPFTMEVNDLPHAVRYGNDPAAFVTRMTDVLAGYAGPHARPACLDITVHAHVYGRPAGSVAFVRALRAVREHAETAFLTHHQRLADMFAPATMAV